MNRRGFLSGLITAPAVIITPGLLMPVHSWHEGIRGEIRWWYDLDRLDGPYWLHCPVLPVISDGRRWLRLSFYPPPPSSVWIGAYYIEPPVYIENGEDICAEIRGDRWERQDGVWKRLPGLPPQSS